MQKKFLRTLGLLGSLSVILLMTMTPWAMAMIEDAAEAEAKLVLTLQRHQPGNQCGEFTRHSSNVSKDDLMAKLSWRTVWLREENQDDRQVEIPSLMSLQKVFKPQEEQCTGCKVMWEAWVKATRLTDEELFDGKGYWTVPKHILKEEGDTDLQTIKERLFRWRHAMNCTGMRDTQLKKQVSNSVLRVQN